MDEQNEQVSAEALRHKRRCKAMKVLEEKVDRARIQDELRYENFKAVLQIQTEELLALTQRIEQLERAAAVHPLKKLVGKKARKSA